MNRTKIIIPVLFLFSLTTGFFLSQGDIYFEIGKNIEIFGKVYKEVTLNYVDEISPEQFMRSGIKGMLETLDPYSVFIDESKKGEVDMLTTGKYGGIGISIGVKGEEVTVTEVMAGYSAQRQGLRVGDVIQSINGINITTNNLDEVSGLVRGEPGTELNMIVKRPGGVQVIEFHLIREEIQVLNLSFADFISETDGIVYFRLDRFSRRAGEELKQAVNKLKSQGEIKGVVLDLRSNPGGLLESAVEILEKFIAPGEKLVETRGRTDESTKSYISSEVPIFGDVPLAVLIDGNSASASEIVAGSIQDLDRGIIAGTQSFGKGLVQTIIPTPYKTMLKLTTAKYYIPSGRCIQKLDYMHSSKGVFITTPDSLKKVFTTKNKRKVFEAGGVSPDTVIANPELSDLSQQLLKRAIFFKYVSDYLNRNKEVNIENIKKPELIDDFISYLKRVNFFFESSVENKFNEFVKAIEVDKKFSNLIGEVKSLSPKIKTTLESEIKTNQDEINWLILAELASRIDGESGRTKILIKTDHQLRETVKILQNNQVYNSLLTAH